MEGRLARWAPLGASLFGHLALLAAAAGAALLARDDPPPREPVRVVRATDAPPAGAPALRLVDLAAAAGGGAAEGPVVPLDTADPRYRPYLLAVRRRIWERWRAPALAPGDPARGVLVVEFTLTRSGRLAASAVSDSSGVAALDRAALRALASAEPFTPLPEAVGETLRVRARFVYD